MKKTFFLRPRRQYALHVTAPLVKISCILLEMLLLGFLMINGNVSCSGSTQPVITTDGPSTGAVSGNDAGDPSGTPTASGGASGNSAAGSGEHVNTGGTGGGLSTAGTSGSGGIAGSGGIVGTGGTNGNFGSGGMTGTGGLSGSGGSSGTGGAVSGGGSGGSVSSGGSSGAAAVPIDTIAYSGTFSSATGWTENTLTVAGISRRVLIYRPSTAANLPLVLVFSGSGTLDNFLSEFADYRGAPAGQSALAGAFSAENAVLALPEDRDLGEDWDHGGGGRYWQTEDASNPDADDPNGNPDLMLARAIIQESRARYAINSRRVYTMGYSSGGFFSSLAAMTLRARIAGFAERSSGWATCLPRHEGNSYRTSLTDCTAILSMFQSTFPGQFTCSDPRGPQPFNTVPTDRKVPAYLRHGNQDNAIPVYYTCALNEALVNNGYEVDAQIINGDEHSVGSEFFSGAWEFLRTKSLP